MKSKSNKRTIVLLILLVVTLLVAYPMLKTDNIAEDPAIVDATSAEVTATLEKLKTVEINVSLLKSQEFLSLLDIAQKPLALPLGRENPFAPVK